MSTGQLALLVVGLILCGALAGLCLLFLVELFTSDTATLNKYKTGDAAEQALLTRIAGYSPAQRLLIRLVVCLWRRHDWTPTVWNLSTYDVKAYACLRCGRICHDTARVFGDFASVRRREGRRVMPGVK